MEEVQSDGLIKCPFVPTHSLRKEKFALHLSRCKNSIKKDSPYYNNILNMIICKFNSTHYVHKDDIEKHYEVCQEAKMAKKKKEEQNEKICNWQKYIGTNIINDTTTVNWDNEELVESYDPMIKIKTNPNILFNPTGLTKSERKKFRNNRRLEASIINK